MKQRILAVVGAVALVALAIVARTQLGAGSDGGGSSAGGKPVVACTADLMTVCDALADAGKIAEGPPTLDLSKAATPDAAIDAWITWDSAPGIANFDADADNRPAVWGESVPIGSSPLAVAAYRDIPANLPDACTVTTFEWSCVSGSAASDLAIGVGLPSTAEGLARLYPVADALKDPADGFDQVDASAVKQVLTSPQLPQRAFPSQFDTIRTRPGALNLLIGPLGAFRADSRMSALIPPGGAAIVAVVTGRSEPSTDLGALRSAVVKSGGEAISALGLDPGTGTLAPGDRAGELFALRERAG